MKRIYTLLALFSLISVGSLRAQSELWGVTTTGGDGFGVLFSMPTGSTSPSYTRNFAGAAGSSPQHTKLIQASNGKIYGTLISGGLNNLGVLFEYDPSTGVFTKKWDFASATGSSPRGPLMQASDGKLYGLTQGGGANSVGAIYYYDISTSTYSLIASLTTSNGAQPFGGFTELSPTNGKLYAVTRVGGANSGGAIIEYSLGSTSYTKTADMSASTGTLSFGNLVESGSKLYGLAAASGTNSAGTIFEYDYSTQTVTKKFDFGGTNGSSPNGSLYKASDGNLYGMTTSGGANSAGVIFKYTASTSSFSTIWSFTSTSGSAPSGNVIQGSNGNLYGFTRTGGANGNGVIFEYNISTSSYTNLVNLQSNTTVGGNPFGTLLQASNGKFYGLTNNGGIAGVGVLFEYDLGTNTYTKKIDLNFALNGGVPHGAPIYASNGKIYGTCVSGGTSNAGVIYEFNRSSSSYSKVADFNTTNGSAPYGSLVQASNGKLYGVSSLGGLNSAGTLYEFDYSTNTLTKKVDLSSTIGSGPLGALINYSGNANKLYGLTKAGGTSGLGVIFEYDISTATYTKKFDFSGIPGSQPSGSLFEAPNAKLYGITQFGGSNSLGVIFEYDPATNTYTKKIDLSTTTGTQPLGSLTLGADGNLYGMTQAGGTNSVGTVFKYDYVNNVISTMVNLSSTTGSAPKGSLVKTANNNLYGVTTTGGTNSVGTLFEYNTGTSAFTKLMDFSTLGGFSPGYTSLLEVCVKPSTPGSISSSTTALCEGSSSSLTFSIATVATATSYAWSLPAGASITSGSLTNNITVNFSGVAAGVYSYSVGGTNGCGTGTNATSGFTVNAKPTITVNSGAICNGKSFTLTPSGAATYTYSGGSNVVAPTTNTFYNVTGTSSVGCVSSNTAVATITVNALPTISFAASSTVVCAGNTVMLSGTGGSSYSWSGGITNAVAFAPALSGSYTVTGTDINSCTNTAVASVSVNAVPTVTTSASSTAVCIGGTVSLSGGGANTYIWSGGITNGVAFAPSSTQTYTVTGTAVNGCTNTATRAVVVNTLPIVTANSSTTAVCIGGLVTLTGGGASSYLWTGGVTNGVAFAPSANQTYTVTGTDGNGCQNTATKAITVYTLPVVTANSSTTQVCSGGSVTLTGGGANTYGWTGGVTNGVAFAPSSTQTYTVTGTDVNGCQNTATKIITVNTTPNVSASVSSTAVCTGGTVMLSGSGASTYTWSGGITNGVAFAPASTNTYSLSGSSSAGCTNTNVVTVTVVVNALPVVGAGTSTTSVCSGFSITLNGSGANTYTWTGGVTNNVAFAPSATNTYSVSGTNTLTGCTSTNVANITVTVYARPVVTASTSTSSVCAGFPVTLNGGGANTYTWTGGVSNNVTFTPSATQSYTVTGTSTAGCTSTNNAFVSVTVNPIPVITGNATHPVVCQNATTSLSGGGASTYTWASASGTIANLVAFAPSATASYTVVGQSASGCISLNFPVVTITVNALPTITVNSGSICSGGSFTMIPGGASSYVFSGGFAVVSPTITSTYSVIGTNSAGCTSSAAAVSTVVVNALPAIAVNSGTMCAGSSFTINPTLSTGAAISFTYSGGTSTITPGAIVVNPTGNTTYSVVGSSTAGCTSSNIAVSILTVSPAPAISAVSGAICLGDVFTHSVSGATSYTYSSGGATVSPVVTTTYSISGSNAFGCVSPTPAVVIVTVNPLPNVTIAGSNSICSGQTATLTASGANSYIWFSATPGPTLVITPTTTAVYSVVGTDTNNCSASASLNVNYINSPTITANNGAMCPGDSFTIVPSGASSYTYSGGSAVVSPSITTNYSITGTSSLGCVSQSPAVITVSVVNNITVTISGNTVVCSGESVSLTANGVSTYSWNTGATTASIVQTPSVNTSYSVIGFSGSCSDTGYVNVKVNPLPVVLASSSSASICVNETATLVGTGASTYSWSAPSFSATTAAVVVTPTATTVYLLTGMDNNGCSNTSTVNLLVDNCTGLAENQLFSNILLYPNPNQGNFVIHTTLSAEITIVDALGQVIVKQKISEGLNAVDLTREAKGIYFVKVGIDNKVVSYRVIVH